MTLNQINPRRRWLILAVLGTLLGGSSLVFTRPSRFTPTPIPAAPQRGGRQLKGATR
jgi:hypothetical protein